MPATLILTPSVTNETYSPCLNNDDLVVTKKEIESKLSSVDHFIFRWANHKNSSQ